MNNTFLKFLKDKNVYVLDASAAIKHPGIIESLDNRFEDIKIPAVIIITTVFLREMDAKKHPETKDIMRILREYADTSKLSGGVRINDNLELIFYPKDLSKLLQDHEDKVSWLDNDYGDKLLLNFSSLLQDFINKKGYNTFVSVLSRDGLLTIASSELGLNHIFPNAKPDNSFTRTVPQPLEE